MDAFRKRRLLSRAFIDVWIAAALAAALMSAAPAQETQPNPPHSPPAAADSSPGLLGEIGKLLKSPIDMLPSLPKAPPEPAAAAAPEPRNEAVTRNEPDPPPPIAPSSRLLPGFATGREICARAANGAPDCKIGADKLCQSKGYKEGKSLEVDSSYGCSPKPIREALAGKREKICGTENYVTRAFCQ